MSHSKTQRQNISTRTALNSSQHIDGSITNGAKIVNFPPECSLLGRSNKFVRDMFETKEPVYNDNSIFSQKLKKWGEKMKFH